MRPWSAKVSVMPRRPDLFPFIPFIPFIAVLAVLAGAVLVGSAAEGTPDSPAIEEPWVQINDNSDTSANGPYGLWRYCDTETGTGFYSTGYRGGLTHILDDPECVTAEGPTGTTG